MSYFALNSRYNWNFMDSSWYLHFSHSIIALLHICLHWIWLPFSNSESIRSLHTINVLTHMLPMTTCVSYHMHKRGSGSFGMKTLILLSITSLIHKPPVVFSVLEYIPLVREPGSKVTCNSYLCVVTSSVCQPRRSLCFCLHSTWRVSF